MQAIGLKSLVDANARWFSVIVIRLQIFKAEVLRLEKEKQICRSTLLKRLCIPLFGLTSISRCLEKQLQRWNSFYLQSHSLR